MTAAFQEMSVVATSLFLALSLLWASSIFEDRNTRVLYTFFVGYILFVVGVATASVRLNRATDGGLDVLYGSYRTFELFVRSMMYIGAFIAVGSQVWWGLKRWSFVVLRKHPSMTAAFSSGALGYVVFVVVPVYSLGRGLTVVSPNAPLAVIVVLSVYLVLLCARSVSAAEVPSFAD